MSKCRRNSEEDPRITAYVVGELNEAERAAFELEIANSPALLQEVEEVGALVSALRVELESNRFSVRKPLEAQPVYRDQVKCAGEPERFLPLPSRWGATVGISAIAATLVLITLWQFWSAATHDKMISSVVIRSQRPDDATGSESESVNEPRFTAAFQDVAHVAYSFRGRNVDALAMNAGLPFDLLRPGTLRGKEVVSSDADPLTEPGFFNLTVRYQHEF